MLMCTPAGEVNRTAAAVAEFGLYTVGYSVADIACMGSLSCGGLAPVITVSK